MHATVYDARHHPITLGRRIGGGGEGDVYLVTGRAGVVAKIYTKPTREAKNKLAQMIEHPPSGRENASGHVNLAWPSELLYDASRPRAFVGFLMPQITGSVPLLEVFNPRLRARTLPDFDRRYLFRTARNLAAVLVTLHRAGYVVGDLNESNTLVAPSALVSFIDCDSFQVRATPNGRAVTYPCPVGKLEYTAPELQGKVFSAAVRRPEADRFALGVLIFQLLMEGRHPFSGMWKGSGEPPSIEEKIRRGCFAYADRPACPIVPPPNAAPLNTLPRAVADLVRACFVAGHDAPARRPSPEAWRDTLTRAERSVNAAAPVRSRPVDETVRAVEQPEAPRTTKRVSEAATSPARPPVTTSPRPARAAVRRRRAAPTTKRPASGRGRIREFLATLAGIFIIVGTTVGGGWLLLHHYGLLSPAPWETHGGGDSAATTTAPSGRGASAAGAGACDRRAEMSAAATAAAAPRAVFTPANDSWVAYSPSLHIRFYAPPWWDEKPAQSRGIRYTVGTAPGAADLDQLDIIRAPGSGGSASVAVWQEAVDGYTHQSAASPVSTIDTATIGEVTRTSRPRPQKAAGYDGYIGQVQFTENGARRVDATVWVGQVGCDRVVMVFAGTPTRSAQIAAAVAQVLATIDFSAR